MTNEAPVNVAECPPLGEGGTPSIYGNAHNHFLSTIIIKKDFHYHLKFVLMIIPEVNPLIITQGNFAFKVFQ